MKEINVQTVKNALPTGNEALISVLQSLQDLSSHERKSLALVILLCPDLAWYPTEHSLHHLCALVSEFYQEDPLGGQLLKIRPSDSPWKK